jgi:hypothetical protein
VIYKDVSKVVKNAFLTRHGKEIINSDRKIIRNFKIHKKKLHASNKNSYIVQAL